jgi:uncharacterized LabA/DUF88 family protein
LIIKPKGLDIALAVRMLEDAHRNLYQRCFLVTSDADYLPLIKAVRQLGKQVYVLAYGEDITKWRSEFEYVPDAYVDLGEKLKDPVNYQLDPSKVPG